MTSQAIIMLRVGIMFDMQLATKLVQFNSILFLMVLMLENANITKVRQRLREAIQEKEDTTQRKHR